MIEAFHSYGLKTVFTAPELVFIFGSASAVPAGCDPAAHDRRQNAIDNCQHRGRSHPLRNLRKGLMTRHPAKTGQMHDFDRAASGRPA
jgi:hypothetical protein